MAASSISQEQEILRKQLRPSEYINRIDEVIEFLRDHGLSLSKNQIDVKKLELDSYFRLLAKSLPDLKAVEVQQDKASPVKFVFMTGQSVDSTELRQIVEERETPVVNFKFNA